ncbi:alpha/beta fold hydrolase [Methylobacterium mesophilicum]|uniref:alpha/beta hydrolase family protein n=1 Tax=Methylobacterium mesophilicum TaxID=39956 RepID=UPI002F357966
MTHVTGAPAATEGAGPRAMAITCRDGYRLNGRLWRPDTCRAPVRGSVVVNPATGVRARYNRAYARFLAERGFAVLTYDYRGIGDSRPARLRGCGIRWRDWGELDFDAAVRWIRDREAGPLMVVGHSFGGFLPDFAEAAGAVDRILTVGAQFACRHDYRAVDRLEMIAKWHLLMPSVTAAMGYFPGHRLGWIEDLPAGVAYEWAFRGRRMEASYPAADRPALLARFAAVRAPILAVGVPDDPFGTPAAIRRGLGYYVSSPRIEAQLTPSAIGAEAPGHFGLFNARRSGRFWTDTLRWLGDGHNPWPEAAIDPGPPIPA